MAATIEDLVGDERAAGAIIALLDNPDDEIAREAATALGTMRVPEAAEALMRARLPPSKPRRTIRLPTSGSSPLGP